MSIQFNTIPMLLRPGQRIEFNVRSAVSGLLAQPQKILVIGNRLAGGTVAALTPIQIGSPLDGQTYFKRGSILAAMLDVVVDVNKSASITALALDDNEAGAAATGTITYTGPATGNGTLDLYIGYKLAGQLGGTHVQVGVNAADTATAIGAAVATAINAMDLLYVTAAADAGVVTLTAKNAGETGNYIDIRHNFAMGQFLPKGISATIVAMSGGTGNPSITDAIDAIGSTQYNTIIMPYTDATNLSALAAELLTRWDGLHTNDGIAFAAISGSFSTLTTFGATRNDAFVSIMDTDTSPTPPWIFAANYGAMRATQSSPNQLGRPLQTLALTHCAAPIEADRFIDDEREQLLVAGIATYYVDDGDNCLIERAVTTYKTNAEGIPDPSYRDVEKIAIMSYLRFDSRAMVASNFPRSLLMDDSNPIPIGIDVVTPGSMTKMFFARFKVWMANGLTQDEPTFQAEFECEINDADSDELDAIIPPKCIGALRKFNGRMDARV